MQFLIIRTVELEPLADFHFKELKLLLQLQYFTPREMKLEHNSGALCIRIAVNSHIDAGSEKQQRRAANLQ